MKKIYNIQIEDLESGEIVYKEFVTEDGYIPSGTEQLLQEMVTSLQKDNF